MVVGAFGTVKKGMVENIKKISERAKRSVCWDLRESSERCSVYEQNDWLDFQVRKGKQVEDAADLKLGETALVENLKTGAKNIFLGVRAVDSSL